MLSQLNSHFTWDTGSVQLLSPSSWRELQKAVCAHTILIPCPWVHIASLQSSFLPELLLGSRFLVPSPLRSPKVTFSYLHPLLDLTYDCWQGTCSPPPAPNSLHILLPLSIPGGKREEVWRMGTNSVWSWGTWNFFPSFDFSILNFISGSKIPVKYWKAQVDWLHAKWSPAKRKGSKREFVEISP